MNVKLFKLKSGEEVIAMLVDETSETLSIESAVTLQVAQNPKTGQPMQGFGDWPQLSKPGQRIVLPKSSLLVEPMKLHDEIERSYLQAITGLELPNKQPKILMG